MKTKKKKDGMDQPQIGISGFYRVNIVDPDGKVVGDSGYCKNVVTNLGLANYIAYSFASSGGSTGVGPPKYMLLGSLQSSHASSAVNVTGAFVMNTTTAGCMALIATSAHATRGNQTDATTGHKISFLATFISSNCFSTTMTLAAIGMHYTTNATSMMCGGSFTASTIGSAQNVNATYDIIFSAVGTT